MPPSDQEPRYQLVDSNGNVVGSLFGDGSGNVVIADETDTQTTFGANGITTPALEVTSINSPESPRIESDINGFANPFEFTSEVAEIPLPDKQTVEIKLNRIQPSSDNNVCVQFSTDGGSTYITSGYRYQSRQFSSGDVDKSQFSAGDSKIILGKYVQTDRERATPLSLQFAEPQSFIVSQLSWHGTANSSDTVDALSGGGAYGGGASEVNQVRIFTDDGSIGNMSELDGQVIVYPGG